MWLKGVSKYAEKGLVENIMGSRIKTLCRLKTNMMKEGDHNQYINSVREAGKRRKIIAERSFEVEVCNEIAALSPPPSPFAFRDPNPPI
jgi:RNase P subunit RPR2